MEAFLRFLAKAAAVVLLAIATSYLLMYLVIAVLRMSYPFELEWMEGGTVVHVQRVLDGQPLYDEAVPGFRRLWLCTALLLCECGRWLSCLGNGFLPLRLVSFLASLGCFVFIFLIVHEGRVPRTHRG